MSKACYAETVIKLCPPSGLALGLNALNSAFTIWLSLRQVVSVAVAETPTEAESCRRLNSLQGGTAIFELGDSLGSVTDPRHFNVIHHQNNLSRYAVPWIHAGLARQVTHGDWVVFSVPSVYSQGNPEHEDERLLPIEEWKRILEPFEIEELKYYCEQGEAENERILCVLRGELETPRLRKMMVVPDEPFPEGISAIVHTRNEAGRIADCLQTLKGWTDEIIVCDMESEDETVEIAKQFTDNILSHPQILNFDRSRNVSAMRAKYRWVFYLDADERVPHGLGQRLRELILTQGNTFEAMLLPFRHFYANHWMQCLYPGYTAPRLFKNGKFYFRPRLHAGAQVDGRAILFPADNPDLALIHHSYDSLSHYLEKVNRYTDGEAESMHRDGQPFHWQNSVRSFVHDFKSYYDHMGATKDGVHGYLYAFHSAFYRFEQNAKLFERRFNNGQLTQEELAIPPTAEQFFEYMLAVAREKPPPTPPQIKVDTNAGICAKVVWSGPFYDPAAYGEEVRNFLHATAEAGVPVAAHPLWWSDGEAKLPDEEIKRIQALSQIPVKSGFIHITQNFAHVLERHPQAGISIARSMFETDRLPQDWVKGCNRMDYVWVPSEFNRKTFAQAGVLEEKLVVIPGCFDTEPYLQNKPLIGPAVEIASQQKFTFLSVFDWTLHKGWDVLLKGFLQAFERKKDVQLVLKVWSTMGYSAEHVRNQAAEYLSKELDYDLEEDNRIRFLQDRLTQPEMLSLYKACDAFVLPSRGEGWGRPYMEAMGCGKPAISTNWSGNTAFMDEENSYLVDYELVPVSEQGYREIYTYRGHRWAEPNPESLVQALRSVYENRTVATKKGEIAKEQVLSRYSRQAVGKLIAEELEHIQEIADLKNITIVHSREKAAAY